MKMEKKMSKLLKILSICLLVASCSKKTSELTISTENGDVKYSVEEAITQTDMEKGLMDRKSLDKDSGMIFDVTSLGSDVAFWMKDTYIPLDIIFIDSNGIITHIHENAEPLSEELVIAPVADTSFVLELNGGQTLEKNIRVGDKINHNIIK